jgi:hypothetical protein
MGLLDLTVRVLYRGLLIGEEDAGAFILIAGDAVPIVGIFVLVHVIEELVEVTVVGYKVVGVAAHDQGSWS